MGTSNFYNVNASKIYVIDYEDNNHMWEESQDHLGDLILDMDNSFETSTNIESRENLRSHQSNSIGFFKNSLEYLGLDFTININIFIRPGYYSAANLDYEVEWFVDSSDYYEAVDDLIHDIHTSIDYYPVNKGVWAIHKSSLENKLTKIESELTSNVEKILSKISEPYNCLGTFSNGEALYEKV